MERPENQPWPTYPMTFKVSTSHEEGGTREYQASTTELVGDEQGRVRALRLATVERTPDGRFAPVEGTEREIPADLVLLAMGFTGPETGTLVEQTGADLTALGTDRAWRRLRHVGAGHVRRGGRRPWAVADRLGDRRGSRGGCRRGRLACGAPPSCTVRSRRPTVRCAPERRAGDEQVNAARRRVDMKRSHD